MRRFVLLAPMIVCASACGGEPAPPSTPAPPPIEAHAVTPSPTPAPSAVTTPVVAPETPPILAAAVRGWGPYPNLCDGLPHVTVEGDMFDEGLECDEELEQTVRETLALPEPPFDEANLVWVPQLMPFHDEVGALVLAIRNGHDWYLLVVETNEGDPVGAGPTLGLEAGGLRVEHSGAEPRLTFRSTRAVWDGDPIGDEPAEPGRARSETRLVTCALRERQLACASVVIASAGSLTSPAGDVLEHASWSVTASFAPGDVIRLSEPQGTPPEDLELARPRQLLFDDAALTPARTFSNRCHRLRESEDLDGAEVACRAGLAEHPSHEEEGALLYDVGRIAETRGDIAAARAAYTRSLTVRPRNAVVRARLEALPSAE